MKILLAPSETKKSGGVLSFDLKVLLFDDLYTHRIKILNTYVDLLQKGDMQILSKMMGVKRESDILYYTRDDIRKPAMKAIERYTGVAFSYLGYEKLDTEVQHYIDSHVILFSNLFGPILASNPIPEYKLKQGETVGGIKTEKIYYEYSADLMEKYLENDEILDLRAGFYNKFYKPKSSYTTLKFIKDGKVVSHWAKAYRGIVVRKLAQNHIESIDEFMKMEIEGLAIKEILQKKIHTEIVYDIIDNC